MSKIIALYKNEMFKTTHKISLLIMVVIMVCAIGGCGATMKDDDYYFSYGYDYGTVESELSNETSNITMFEEECEYMIKQIELCDKSDEYALNMALSNYLYSKQTCLRSRIKIIALEQLLAVDRNMLCSSYKYEVCMQILQRYSIWISDPFHTIDEYEKDSESLPRTQADIDALLSPLEKAAEDIKGDSDWRIIEGDYIEYLRKEYEYIKADTTIGERERAFKLEINELMQQCDYKNDYIISSSVTTSQQLLLYKMSLDQGVDLVNHQYGDLNDEQRSEFVDMVALYEYDLKNGTALGQEITKNSRYHTSAELMDMLTVVGLIFSTLILIIIAGSAVSSEISTGSIKSLVIAPVKRWKIYTSKLMMILTSGLALILINIIVSVLFSIIFVGTSGLTTVATVSDGVAHEHSYVTMLIAKVFVDSIPMIIFALLAYMMSCTTRNTAVSVAVPIVGFLGGTIINSILLSGDINNYILRKFLPIQNMSLVDRVFENFNFSSVTNFIDANSRYGTMSGNSILFSVIYLIVLTVCMIYIGMDSFNRSDIK